MVPQGLSLLPHPQPDPRLRAEPAVSPSALRTLLPSTRVCLTGCQPKASQWYPMWSTAATQGCLLDARLALP